MIWENSGRVQDDLGTSQCGHRDCSVDRFQAKSQSKRVAKRYAVVQTHSPTATSDGIETQGPRLDKECFYSYHGGFLKKRFWRLLISLFEGKFQEHATNRFRFSKSVTRLCIVSDFPRVFHSKTKLVRDSWEDCFYSYHARFLIFWFFRPKSEEFEAPMERRNIVISLIHALLGRFALIWYRNRRFLDRRCFRMCWQVVCYRNTCMLQAILPHTDFL